MERIDYSKLKELRVVEIEKRPNKKYRLLSLFLFIVLTSTQLIDGSLGVWVGIFSSLFIFCYKVLRSIVTKEKYLFFSQIDDNYIEIVYKNKLQAINSKVTCHPECNPVRIVQTESNRLYTLYNTSDSILTSLS